MLALGDVAVVAAFVVLGRSSHAEGLDPVGLATTAAPFLVALAAAWLALRSLGVRPTSRVHAAGVAGTTAAAGLLLRAASGSGTALSFTVVTLAVVGGGLLLVRAATRRAVPG